MKTTSRFLAVTCFGLCSLATLPSCQSITASQTPEPGTCQRNGEIRLELATSKTIYQVGEELAFTVRPSVDAYLAVWVHGADGKTHRIFPNAHSSRRVFRGGTIVRFPGSEDFRFRVSRPTGRDTLIVIASTKPIDERTTPLAGSWLKGISVATTESEKRGEARMVYQVAP